MKEVTILLTCCLGDYMQGTIRCYKENPDNRPVKVIGCDMNDMVYNFVGVDRFYKVDRCDSPRYIDQIMSICLKEKVDVLIPFNTNELELVSLFADAFERIGTKVLVSNHRALEISNDKIHFHDYFIGDIPTPKATATSSYDRLKEFLRWNQEKTFTIKQRHGCGSRGFRIIGSNECFLRDKPSGVFIQDDELQQLFDNSEQFLIQEYLPGNELTVDLVVDHGKVLYHACKLNSNMENGVARRSTVVSDFPCAVDPCKFVCEKLQLHGNIGFDLKCDAEGKPYIIDCNPRMTATVSLIAKAGVNMPYIALQLALGEPVRDDYKLKYGTSIVRRITDYYFDESGELLE